MKGKFAMFRTVVSLFTRTPLHVGCGSSVGIVDLPVLRERVTGFPTVPGSALKGSLSDLFVEGEGENRKVNGAGLEIFGKQDCRGRVLIGEARLAAFPVRSAKQGFAWLVSPLTLARLGIACAEVNGLGEEEVFAAGGVALEGKVVLEEYPLTRRGEVPGAIVAALKGLCAEPLWQDTLAARLVVVSDTLMQYFAQNACEIAQHNKVDDEKGTVADGALFAQENVPSETLFVGEWLSDDEAQLANLCQRVAAGYHLLQVGADATTGLGWCRLTLTHDNP